MIRLGLAVTLKLSLAHLLETPHALQIAWVLRNKFIFTLQLPRSRVSVRSSSILFSHLFDRVGRCNYSPGRPTCAQFVA